jgi:hypothetical protein
MGIHLDSSVRSVNPTNSHPVTHSKIAHTTNPFDQIQFDSQDVTGIHIMPDQQKIIIINAYNACTTNNTITEMSNFLKSNFPDEAIPHDTYVILLEYFNCHHPIVGR